MLTILFLGDIVGEPGRNAVIAQLPHLKESHALDFIIVNGENAAGGRGITPKITIDLLRAGVSVITTGDHIWDQKEIFAFIDTEPRLLRPVNYPTGAPGNGRGTARDEAQAAAVIAHAHARSTPKRFIIRSPPTCARIGTTTTSVQACKPNIVRTLQCR